VSAYRRWSREENERIAAMWQAGASYVQIAAEFNATIGQISSKIHHWGMSRTQRPRVYPGARWAA
jgi:transposase-like protein